MLFSIHLQGYIHIYLFIYLCIYIYMCANTNTRYLHVYTIFSYTWTSVFILAPKYTYIHTNKDVSVGIDIDINLGVHMNYTYIPIHWCKLKHWTNMCRLGLPQPKLGIAAWGKNRRGFIRNHKNTPVARSRKTTQVWFDFHLTPYCAQGALISFAPYPLDVSKGRTHSRNFEIFNPGRNA